MQPQVAVLDGHGEVQRGGATDLVDGVHVAFLMREDVLEHIGRAVYDAVQGRAKMELWGGDKDERQRGRVSTRAFAARCVQTRNMETRRTRYAGL